MTFDIWQGGGGGMQRVDLSPDKNWNILQIKFDDSHKPVGRDNFDPVGIEQGLEGGGGGLHEKDGDGKGNTEEGRKKGVALIRNDLFNYADPDSNFWGSGLTRTEPKLRNKYIV